MTLEPLPSEHTKRIKIVYLYHQEEKAVFDTLYKHLMGLRRLGLVKEWYETEAGTNFQEQMKTELEDAQVLLLLITSEFNASDRFTSSEMLENIRKCANKGTRVWPIIAKSCHWETSSFKEYEIFFGKEKPIISASSWNSADEPYKLLVEQIFREVNQMLSLRWVQDGDLCYHQMHLTEALSAYEQSLKYTTDFPPALLGMVRVYRKLGEFEKAKWHFEKLLSLQAKNERRRKDGTYSDWHEDVAQTSYKGYALIELHRFQDACSTFQSAYKYIGSLVSDLQRNICAEAYAGEGDAYFGLGNQSPDFKNLFEKAIDAYKHAKELAVDTSKYLVKIGNAYLKLGKKLSSNLYYGYALETYRQTIDHFPECAAAYLGQGNVLYHMRLYKEAFSAYETAIKLDPYLGEAHGNKAWLLLQTREWQEALSAYKTALSLDHKNSWYHYGKGRALVLLGYHQDALNSYNQALEYNYSSTDLMIHRADVLVMLGDIERICGQVTQASIYYTDASDSYNRALSALKEEHSDEYYIFYGLGNIQFGLGYWENAREYYQTAINFAPYKADAYFGLGKTLIELGLTKEAFEAFSMASSRCSHAETTIDLADIYAAYGDAYVRVAGDPDSDTYYVNQEKARKYYENAIYTRNRDLDYFGLGKTCIALHCHQEAITAFDEALALNSRLAQCYFFKGKCYYILGRYTEAQAMYETAMTSGFDSIELQLALGDTLLALKRYVDARVVFENVIEHLTKDVAHAYCGKGVALCMLSMYEAALQSFQEADRIDPFICLQPPYKEALQNIRSLIDRKLYQYPQEYLLYRHKGNVLLLIGEQFTDAVDAYTSAIAYGDNSADAYYYRGEAYYRLYEPKKAMKDYKKALNIDPSHLGALQGKAIIEQEKTQRNFFTKWLF